MYGFGRIITFPEHDELRVNQATTAQFNVVKVAGARQTQYRASREGFPALQSWIKALRLPGGFCVRLRRSLLYFESEVEKPDRCQTYVNRLTYVVRLDGSIHRECPRSRFPFLPHRVDLFGRGAPAASGVFENPGGRDARAVLQHTMWCDNINIL